MCAAKVYDLFGSFNTRGFFILKNASEQYRAYGIFQNILFSA